MLLIFPIALIFDFVIFVKNVHAVIVYDSLDILHAAVTHFNFIFLNILLKLRFLGKWVSSRFKSDCPILVVTLLLYGVTNHVTFRWQFLFLFSKLLLLGVR